MMAMGLRMPKAGAKRGSNSFGRGSSKLKTWPTLMSAETRRRRSLNACSRTSKRRNSLIQLCGASVWPKLQKQSLERKYKVEILALEVQLQASKEALEAVAKGM